MTSRIFLSLILGVFALGARAQVQAELTIENQSISGGMFYFDLYLKAIGSNDVYLGNADFILTFNTANFNSPTLNPVGSAPGFCTFVPSTQNPTNNANTQNFYFNNTSTTLSGNLLIINLSGPVPNSTTINTNVARINSTASTHRLGRFVITGINANASGAALQWKTTTPGLMTQVYSFDPVTLNDSPVTLTATNPPGTALPVKLKKFRVQPGANAILLNWESEQEVNFSGYELQRSLDGEEFEIIGWTAARGGQNPQAYEHADDGVASNLLYYYRLKMMDLDGSFEYSPVRSAKLEGDQKPPRIFPNPASSHLTLGFDLETRGEVAIELYNEVGSRIHAQSVQAEEGESQVELSLVGVPPGFYQVRVKTAGQVFSEKVMVAK